MFEEESKKANEKLNLISTLTEQLLNTWNEFGRMVDERGEFFEKLRDSHITLSNEIQSKRATANRYTEVLERYEGLMTQMKQHQDTIDQINERMFAEIKNLHRPPVPLQHVIIACLFLLGLKFGVSSKSRSSRRKLSIRELWRACKKYLVSETGLKARLQKINYWTLKKENLDKTRDFVREHWESFGKKRIRCVSRVGEVIAEIVLNMLEVHALLAGYDDDIEGLHEKRDDLMTEINSLSKRQSDIAKRLGKLGNVCCGSSLEENFKEAQPESALQSFIAKLENLVTCQKAAVEELQEINQQLGKSDNDEELLRDAPLSICETEDLDDFSSPVGTPFKKVIIV